VPVQQFNVSFKQTIPFEHTLIVNRQGEQRSANWYCRTLPQVFVLQPLM